jgi:type II secretion system protein G
LVIPLVFLGQRPRFFILAISVAGLIACFLMWARVESVPTRLPPKVDRTRRELIVLRTALEWFRAHCQRYPSDAEGLKALVRNPNAPGWQGPYIDRLPPDVWTHPFVYSCTSGQVRLLSLGPDGLAGTPDDLIAPPPDYKELLDRIDIGDLPRWEPAATNAAP